MEKITEMVLSRLQRKDGPARTILTKLVTYFMITARSFGRLITHLFIKGDKYPDSDAVFGVKDSLVLEFKLNDSYDSINEFGFSSPFYKVQYDFRLKALIKIQ